MVATYVSITTLDHALARLLEPRAASPTRRLQTIERLARAGIPVGVSVSPLIPFINEPELERVLQQARDAGASTAFATVLRLPWEVSPLFQQWLQTHFPQRSARVMARVREMRGGRDNDPRYGHRMQGQGTWASLLRQRFERVTNALGLSRRRVDLDLSRFAKVEVQGRLF
jgi:DNA repair photolyase